MPDGIRSDFEHAAGESQAAYASRLDFPETHLQLAGLALTMRNLGAAAEAFRTALALDPQRGEAWSMLVRIAAATEGAEAARAVLAEALARLPDDIGLLRMDAELSGAPFAPSLLPPPAEGPPDAE
jgi:cytochrome c-type biogenesis protein CcmH/NrfG